MYVWKDVAVGTAEKVAVGLLHLQVLLCWLTMLSGQLGFALHDILNEPPCNHRGKLLFSYAYRKVDKVYFRELVENIDL